MINALLRYFPSLPAAYFLGVFVALALLTPQNAQEDVRSLMPAQGLPGSYAVATLKIPSDFEATVSPFPYDVADPFTYTGRATRKYSVELLTDGRFGIYWPVGVDSSGKCFTAWILLDSVTSVREDIEKRLLYGSKWSFVPEEYRTKIVGSCG